MAFFLLQSAGIMQSRLYRLCSAQVLIGTVLLGAMVLNGLNQASAVFQGWQAINAVFCAVLAIGVCRFAIRRRIRRRWFLIGATLFGLGIALNGVLNADAVRTGTAYGNYLFPVYLLLVWLVMTGRSPDRLSAFDDLASEQAEHFEALRRLRAEQAAQSDFLSRRALDSERKRIASDLHDGVGSQLVNLIATLDLHSRQQQVMATALEQCLLDLKIMVDSIDGEHDSIIDALARLRYRIQPSLDRQGIQMTWNMQHSPELDLVASDKVLQLLRISQEAVSNIIRHSEASVVEVTCRYAASNRSLLLEICDNGRGIQATLAGKRMTGKGLRAMRERAETIGASFEFSHCQSDRTGTRIMLLLPVPVPVQPHKTEGVPALNGFAHSMSEHA
ncbi:MAG: sensor histidine kinase [Rhodoferax sp.]